MKTPIAWQWDLADAVACFEAINAAFQTRTGFVVHKRRLEDARDNWNAAVTSFERAGLAEQYEETYLLMFDALALLTEALRGRSINPSLLDQARSKFKSLLWEGGGN